MRRSFSYGQSFGAVLFDWWKNGKKSRYMGYQNAVKTMRNASQVSKRRTAHESIRQRLMRLREKENAAEKQEAGSNE